MMSLADAKHVTQTDRKLVTLIELLAGENKSLFDGLTGDGGGDSLP